MEHYDMWLYIQYSLWQWLRFLPSKIYWVDAISTDTNKDASYI